MDINEFKSVSKEFEKSAFVGKVLKKLFTAKKKKPFAERMGVAGKSLLGTGVITGGIGLGGAAYGSVSQPGSIKHKNPSRFSY